MHHGLSYVEETLVQQAEAKRQSQNQALESLANNKARGGDGIPVELFKILKDDAVKVLHSICQQVWKSQQWAEDWK